jgi:hypothetical protein
MENHALEPGERCPYCGQIKRGKYQRKKNSQKAAQASRENGKKGGRPKKQKS